MRKLPIIAVGALATIAIGLSTWSLVRSFIGPTRDIEYTMYIGTNDKDTYQLEIPLNEARDIVHNTMMDYFSDGFTMFDAQGVWRDEHGTVTLEYTFVCVIETHESEKVYKAADDLLVKLNQSTILIVANEAYNVDFYTGK